MYKLPRLLDINAKSVVFRDSKKLAVISRCLELEKPWVLEKLKEEGYVAITACPEAEHINMIGFKLAGIIARCNFEEVAIVTVDGSMHCTQLHWALEEIYKLMKPNTRRKHLVVHENSLVEISEKAVKCSRFLSKVEKLLKGRSINEGGGEG
jgi:hypothetical protein